MTASATSRRAAAATGSRRDAVVNLRLPVRTRDLIDSAASSLGKSRTEFMIETARRQAIDVLLDQRLFELDRAQFEAFTAALDAPAPPNDALRKLFSRKAPWEA